MLMVNGLAVILPVSLTAGTRQVLQTFNRANIAQRHAYAPTEPIECIYVPAAATTRAPGK
ncbi:MAG: hypothetical protein ACXWKG_00445 [Limisphaerales bacterium]